MRYFADENYREILLSLQLVPELLQLDTHIVIVPGTAPTICQSLLLLANDHRGAAKAPLSQIPSDNSDRNFGFFGGFWFIKTHLFEPAQLLVLALHVVLEVQQVVDLLLERLLRRAHHRHLLVLHLQLALAQVAPVDLLLQARAQARHLRGRPRRQRQRLALRAAGK